MHCKAYRTTGACRQGTFSPGQDTIGRSHTISGRNKCQHRIGSRYGIRDHHTTGIHMTRIGIIYRIDQIFTRRCQGKSCLGYFKHRGIHVGNNGFTSHRICLRTVNTVISIRDCALVRQAIGAHFHGIAYRVGAWQHTRNIPGHIFILIAINTSISCRLRHKGHSLINRRIRDRNVVRDHHIGSSSTTRVVAGDRVGNLTTKIHIINIRCLRYGQHRSAKIGSDGHV